MTNPYNPPTPNASDELLHMREAFEKEAAACGLDLSTLNGRYIEEKTSTLFGWFWHGWDECNDNRTPVQNGKKLGDHDTPYMRGWNAGYLAGKHQALINTTTIEKPDSVKGDV